MRIEASIVAPLLLSIACGSHPETAFLGQWLFASGTRDGVDCFTKNRASESLVGKQAAITAGPIPSPELGPQFVGLGFIPCEHEGIGALWFVDGTTATAEAECSYGGTVGRPGAPTHTVKGSLKLTGRTLALSMSQDVKWIDQGRTVESCTYSYNNAMLSYVGQ